MCTYLELFKPLRLSVACLLGWSYKVFIELTKNGGLSGVVKANDYNAHLFAADEAPEQLGENESHF